MSVAEIRRTVAELLSITVGREVAENETILRDSEPSWDSLKHVQLILMLEEHFGIQFSEKEMTALTSSNEIVQAVEKKNAA